jgi:photosystem II stability/assembly factor-like uncharacterized protein
MNGQNGSLSSNSMKKIVLFALLIFLINSCIKTGNPPIENTIASQSIPNPPTDFKGVINGTTKIDFTWADASNNEDGFKIERKSGTGAYSLIATIGQNVVSFSDTSLGLGATYSYRIYSYNSIGNSNYSSEVSISTQTIPNLPTDLKGVVNGATKIDLTWVDASNNEDGFKIERKSGTGSYSLIATVAQNIVSYKDTGLSASTNYTYRIYSYNIKGNSNFSNEASIQTPNLLIYINPSNNLYKVNFSSDNIGYIAGDKVVLKTTNGGLNWSIIRQSNSITYTAIKFVDDLTGYLGGNDQYYAYVYFTKDGGLTWAEISKDWYQNNMTTINDILYLDNKLIYISNTPSGGKMNGRLFFTGDNGVTWGSRSPSNSSGFNCATYYNGNLLIGGTNYWVSTATYETGTFLISNLQTFDLSLSKIDISESINGISLFNRKAIAVGYNGSISISSDNGLNWSSRTLTEYNKINLNAVILMDDQNAYVGGDNGLILSTIDGGASWSKVSSLNTESIKSFSVKPNGNIYAVGNKGLIMRIK